METIQNGFTSSGLVIFNGNLLHACVSYSYRTYGNKKSLIGLSRCYFGVAERKRATNASVGSDLSAFGRPGGRGRHRHGRFAAAGAARFDRLRFLVVPSAAHVVVERVAGPWNIVLVAAAAGRVPAADVGHPIAVVAAVVMVEPVVSARPAVVASAAVLGRVHDVAAAAGVVVLAVARHRLPVREVGPLPEHWLLLRAMVRRRVRVVVLVMALLAAAPVADVSALLARALRLLDDVVRRERVLQRVRAAALAVALLPVPHGTPTPVQAVRAPKLPGLRRVHRAGVNIQRLRQRRVGRRLHLTRVAARLFRIAHPREVVVAASGFICTNFRDEKLLFGRSEPGQSVLSNGINGGN